MFSGLGVNLTANFWGVTCFKVSDDFGSRALACSGLQPFVCFGCIGELFELEGSGMGFIQRLICRL